MFANRIDARSYNSISNMGTTNSIAKYTWKSSSVKVEGSSAAAATITPSYSGMYAEGQVRANWIVYRLADIMLLKVEALTQLMSDNASDGISDADKAYRDRAFRLVTVINKRSLCQYPRKDTSIRSLTPPRLPLRTWSTTSVDANFCSRASVGLTLCAAPAAMARPTT